VEEAKQKSEYKKTMQRAEEKKRTVRQTIEDMREEYRSLHDRNNALPAHIRLYKKVPTPWPTAIVKLSRKLQLKAKFHYAIQLANQLALSTSLAAR